jgi:hypothetical protein
MKNLIHLALLWVISTLPAYGFDHTHNLWTTWLKDHTREVSGPATQVNYDKARNNPTPLNSYLNQLSSVKAEEFAGWNKNQKMAFLINAYNAFTIKLIIDHKPVKSIKKIGGLLSTPWKIRFIPLLGKELTLDEIEHERLRPVFKDPRIHFAVVCASVGCPRLQQEAFVPEKIEEQMDRATREFLKDQTRNKIEVKDSKTILHLSNIFKWYAADFGGTSNLAGYVIPYSPLSQEDKVKALRQESEIKYLDYDWNLNSY